jgi:phospholipid/cholesterol/gamma-HCH transport system ATP-binding protein
MCIEAVATSLTWSGWQPDGRGGRGGGTASWRPGDTRRVAERLGAHIVAALDVDPRLSRRLGKAGTTVSLEIGRTAGAPDHLTLLLDRQPPELRAGREPAEVTIFLREEQAAAMAVGRLRLPALIAAGQVTATGPVRRFLAVEPVLRNLLRRTAGPTEDTMAAGIAVADAPAAAIDPDLLAVETRGLVKRFGRQEVLSGLDLQIPEGSVSVVLGPSGTGKSVLLKHIIGLLAPDDGEVIVRGRSLRRMNASEALALRRDVGVMFQDGALFSSMDVFDNVAFPLRQHTDLREPQVRQIVEEQLAAVGLSDARGKRPSEISGGMRKRAGLARSLVLDPGIVLCDEPDSGLDPVRTALLGELLVDRHAALGGTMVIVTHNLGLARLVADHAAVVWRGKVVESGPADRLWRSTDPFVQQFLAGAAQGPLDMEG